MIFQENDFLKIYNDMNKLWEATHRQPQALVSFAEIMTNAKAFDETEAMTPNELAFWEKVQRLVLGKTKRANSPQDFMDWPERLVNAFYKPILAENGLIEALKSCTFESQHDQYLIKAWFMNIKAEDTFRDSIYSNFYAPKEGEVWPDKDDFIPAIPDLSADLFISFSKTNSDLNVAAHRLCRLSLDCKASDSKAHGANLLLKYKATYSAAQGTYYFKWTRGDGVKSEILQSLQNALPERSANSALAIYKDLIQMLPSEKAPGSFFLNGDEVKEANELLGILRRINKYLQQYSPLNQAISKELIKQANTLIDRANSIKDKAEKSGVVPKQQDTLNFYDTKVPSSPAASAKGLRDAATYLAQTALNISSGTDLD